MEQPSTFDEIYAAVVGSKKMPYASWKYLIDSADAGVDFASDLSVAALATAFPIINVLIVWAASQPVKWALRRILEDIPHENEVIKDLRYKVNEMINRFSGPGSIPIPKIKVRMPEELLAKGLGSVSYPPLNPIELPLTALDGFQQTPIVKPRVPISVFPKRWTEEGRDYISPSSIYGNRVPNIFVNRVGFTSF